MHYILPKAESRARTYPKSPTLAAHDLFLSLSYVSYVRSQLDPADEAYPAQRPRYIEHKKSARAEAAERRAAGRRNSDELRYPSASAIRHVRTCMHMT